jgi:hypothetical protein
MQTFEVARRYCVQSIISLCSHPSLADDLEEAWSVRCGPIIAEYHAGQVTERLQIRTSLFANEENLLLYTVHCGVKILLRGPFEHPFT